MSIENIIERYKSWALDTSNGVFSEENYLKCKESVKLIFNNKRLGGQLYFIGNGGSHSICLHMTEDFAKVANIPALSLDNPCMITCLGNDYGYENIYVEWFKRFLVPETDTIIAISSSGESFNIIKAIDYASNRGANIITLTAHKKDNSLSKLGDINFHIPTTSYGCAEIYHSLLLHMILDTIVENE